MLELEPDEASTGHGSFTAGLSWPARRDHFLSWLGRIENWERARRVGGRLVRDIARGAHVALSLETGFIEEMLQPDRFHMELVEWSASVDDSDFMVPKAEEGAKDITQDFFVRAFQEIERFERIEVYTVALQAMDRSGGINDDIKRKLTNVFEAWYRPEVARLHVGSFEKAVTDIEAFGDWYDEQRRRSGDDPELIARLHEAAARWRTGLEERLAQGIDRWADRVRPPARVAANPKWLASIAEVEREVVRLVYERDVSAPLLARLEEEIRPENDDR